MVVETSWWSLYSWLDRWHQMDEARRPSRARNWKVARGSSSWRDCEHVENIRRWWERSFEPCEHRNPSKHVCNRPHAIRCTPSLPRSLMRSGSLSVGTGRCFLGRHGKVIPTSGPGKNFLIINKLLMGTGQSWSAASSFVHRIRKASEWNRLGVEIVLTATWMISSIYRTHGSWKRFSDSSVPSNSGPAWDTLNGLIGVEWYPESQMLIDFQRP